ncbi:MULTISPECIES: hypothetical protein [Streptomyces]|uniref:hypothetical protein n=1 Tax=Streptomyces TaxID=1883 RepID=UPI00226EC066|nr:MULTISPECIES: hypothetical protein [unclassified Streptomyces]MCY0941047.1 hypothetical protein [Streptomyces sp. H34-AA3]MCY0949586.1 hypothetical protein [Streptomyces sp. H27-S2]MCZ4087394.1 hypothetical protein [Streptomyces sp. H34-S5]
MSAAVDARQAGQRVEEVLERLAATGDREACAAAEELVRVLMDFYGAGLARVVERIGDARVGDAPLARLLDDELVASLLALHHLNPEDVHTRIARALDAAADPPELVGFDEDTGVLRLRPRTAGSGCGCPSTGAAAQQAVEDALACFAPEVTRVELEPAAAPQPALLQISTRPPAPAQVP